MHFISIVWIILCYFKWLYMRFRTRNCLNHFVISELVVFVGIDVYFSINIVNIYFLRFSWPHIDVLLQILLFYQILLEIFHWNFPSFFFKFEAKRTPILLFFTKHWPRQTVSRIWKSLCFFLFYLSLIDKTRWQTRTCMFYILQT